jgi:hypothetical protein
MITAEALLKIFLAECCKVKSPYRWATMHKIHQFIVYEELKGNRRLPERILGILGYRRVVMYEKI